MKKRVYLSPCVEPKMTWNVDILTLSVGNQSGDLDVDKSGSFDDFEF